VYWREKQAYAILPVKNGMTPQSMLKCVPRLAPQSRHMAESVLGDATSEVGRLVEDRPLAKVQLHHGRMNYKDTKPYGFSFS
jgi:hypothetical protein